MDGKIWRGNRRERPEGRTRMNEMSKLAGRFSGTFYSVIAGLSWNFRFSVSDICIYIFNLGGCMLRKATSVQGTVWAYLFIC